MATKRKTANKTGEKTSSSSKSCKESSSSKAIKVKDGEVVCVAKNAARERTRVKELRDGFLQLQSLIPNIPEGTKLSKLDVLILSTLYIKHLSRILDIDCGDEAGQDVVQKHFVNSCEETTERMQNIDDSGCIVDSLSDPEDKRAIHCPLTGEKEQRKSDEEPLKYDKRGRRTKQGTSSSRKKKKKTKTFLRSQNKKTSSGSCQTETPFSSCKYLHPVKVSFLQRLPESFLRANGKLIQWLSV